MRRVSWFVLLLILILCRTAPAKTYYVSTTGADINPCTDNNIGAPRKTITAGLNCLNSTGNTGGDILFIRGGTYVETIDFPPNKGGTSESNKTLISAFNQEAVVIRPSGGSFVIGLSSPSATRTFRYLIFDGLILDGGGGANYGYSQSDTFGAGFIEHNIYRNGEVRNTHFSGISGINQFDELYNMKVYNNGLTNATPQSHGMYACGMDVKIHDNEFYHNGAYGIQYYYSAAGAVGCSSRTKIYNNKIYDNAAITLAGGVTSGGMIVCCGDNVQIYNNLVYNNGRSGSFNAHGIQLGTNTGPDTNYKVYNNTIYNNKNFGIVIDGGRPHMDIKNNILFGNSSGVITDASGNSTPLDSTNLTVNPNFTNTGTTPPNLTPLAPSAAIDTGVPFGSLTFDINNKPRPSGSQVDIGAIEVQQGGTVDTGPATYYVSQAIGNDLTNDCMAAKQQSSPKASIAGVQGGLSCLTTAGSTLLIKAGTYNEKVDTSTNPMVGGTSWNAPTTIAAFGNDVVTLTIPSGVGLFFKDATNDHYIIIDRLILDGQGLNNTNGFVCYPGTHHIRFQNGEIKNTWYEAVYLSDGVNCEVLNSTIHDWLNLSGVHARGAVSGTVLRGNTIYNGPGSGVKIDANEAGTAISGVIIEQNTVHNVGITSSLAALLLGGTGNTGLIARNNVIYNSYRGIEIVTGTPSAKVLNNTVYGSGTTGIQVNAGAMTTQVKNNISYLNSGTAIGDASGQMVQATNQSTDPSFVNAGTGDFGLQSFSTAINQGTNLSPDVVFDLVGVTRGDYGAYDIGALEFTGTVSGGGGDILGPRRVGGAAEGRGMFQVR